MTADRRHELGMVFDHIESPAVRPGLVHEGERKDALDSRLSRPPEHTFAIVVEGVHVEVRMGIDHFFFFSFSKYCT
jgi:hypothetical protein